MSHAGPLERAELQMKKVRKGRKKREAKLAELSDEEREAYFKQKYEKTLKERAGVIIWDWENRQLPRMRYAGAKETLNQRIEEIKSNNEKFTEQELVKIYQCLEGLAK